MEVQVENLYATVSEVNKDVYSDLMVLYLSASSNTRISMDCRSKECALCR